MKVLVVLIVRRSPLNCSASAWNISILQRSIVMLLVDNRCCSIGDIVVSGAIVVTRSMEYIEDVGGGKH